MLTHIDQLLERAAAGDREAINSLLQEHRDRLQGMVQIYLHDAVRGRVAPSDIVQESLYLAYQRLPKYLLERPIAFYPWLRQIAVEQLGKTHRRHIGAQRRSVSREKSNEAGISGNSAAQLMEQLIALGASPSRQCEKKELQDKAQAAIEQLPVSDREVLVMRYLEQLSVREIADITGLTQAAVKMRHLRALNRLRTLLE